ncbi:hypothetical protein ATANTOWER_030427 [Ataeniobius toweri]|uniref:Uncharacterized protein n=1 Tax=Ataeniobius toweri TaxID=208326 RepID=A0ABU7CMI1_9TELE|nr:hypothetical protein [Ataeniobius toweri]
MAGPKAPHCVCWLVFSMVSLGAMCSPVLMLICPLLVLGTKLLSEDSSDSSVDFEVDEDENLLLRDPVH